jgi:hypothetical protein
MELSIFFVTHSRPTVRRAGSVELELDFEDEPGEPELEDAPDDLELENELVEEDDLLENKDEALEFELLAELELELQPH